MQFLNWDEGYPVLDHGINDCVEIGGNHKMVNKICYAKQSWICTIPRGVIPKNPDDFDPLPTVNSNFFKIF